MRKSAISIDRVRQRIEAEQKAAAEVPKAWHVLRCDTMTNNCVFVTSHSGYYQKHVTDPAPGRWRKLLDSNYTTEGPSLLLVENITREWMIRHNYELYFTLPNATTNLSLPEVHISLSLFVLALDL